MNSFSVSGLLALQQTKLQTHDEKEKIVENNQNP